MFTYKMTFNNGKKIQTITKNLDQAHLQIVNYMTKNDLFECIILCENGNIKRVRKNGEYHWNHNGFSFD
jgi:hypothetical protein